ncbi:MAG: adenylate/guanylate cyclase domain-containing protein, partial [Acidimicrobiia bacterium]
EQARRAAWIAVLPFENMSDDPEQDYFAHGIAEDVITGLAAWSTLRVIARTSSFRYEGENLDQIAEELSVRYVLEGSVRRAGERVRVTAQLIDATGGGHHVWAERYDADMVDIFEVQDQITRSIVVAIDPAIRLAETGPESRVETKSLDAWDHVQLGRSETYKFKPEANTEAIGHFNAALAIDPTYSVAWSELAFAHFVDAWFNFVDTGSDSINLAYEEARKALELDERDAMAHAVLAFVNLGLGRLDAMAASATRAIELNPSLAYGYLALGDAKLFGGDADEGVRIISEAIALSPHDPGAVFFYGARAIGHLLAHRYDEATDDARAAVNLKYGYVLGRVMLTSALAHMGELEDARRELEELLAIKPDFTLGLLDPYPMSDEDRKHISDGLYTAGLPESS